MFDLMSECRSGTVNGYRGLGIVRGDRRGRVLDRKVTLEAICSVATMKSMRWEPREWVLGGGEWWRRAKRS